MKKKTHSKTRKKSYFFVGNIFCVQAYITGFIFTSKNFTSKNPDFLWPIELKNPDNQISNFKIHSNRKVLFITF